MEAIRLHRFYKVIREEKIQEHVDIIIKKSMFISGLYFWSFIYFFNKEIAIKVFFSFLTYLVIVFILLLKINDFFLFKFIVEDKKISFEYLLMISFYFFVLIAPICSLLFFRSRIETTKFLI